MPLNCPQSPVQIHVPSTACDVLTLDNFCLLTCAGWSDLSNHSRMTKIQSRRPEKNHVKLVDTKIPMRILFHHFLPFLSSNPLSSAGAFWCCGGVGGGGGWGEKEKIRAQGLPIIAIFIGKPNGSPCVGESSNPKILKACPKRFPPK